MISKTPFLILGHRGARNKTHFQNSMSAFREAMDAADGFETDTAISADGVIYLIHDITYIHAVEYTLREMLDGESAARAGDRRLDQMQSAEIDTLRLKNGEPIPKLIEALALFRNRPEAIFNIELKSDNTVIPVIDLLRRTINAGEIKPEQLVISSFNFPALAWARINAPEFRLGVLFSPQDQKKAMLFPWANKTDSCYVPFEPESFNSIDIQIINPDFFNLTLSTLTPGNIDIIHAAYPNARFIVWSRGEKEPNSLDMMMNLSRSGLIYAWISDEPRLRKEALQNRIF